MNKEPDYRDIMPKTHRLQAIELSDIISQMKKLSLELDSLHKRMNAVIESNEITALDSKENRFIDDSLGVMQGVADSLLATKEIQEMNTEVMIVKLMELRKEE